MDNLVRIENDVFDIGARLKEIDGGYYPVYNLTKKRYEIHHERAKNSLQVVLPYDSLDARAIQKVYKTRIENAIEMIKNMDKQNEILRKKEQDELREKNFEKIDNLMSEITRRR